MTENNPSDRNLSPGKPGKLAWKLLLSVIIIYSFSFFRFTGELIYSGINFIWYLYAEPFAENIQLGGFIGAFCVLWIIRGLLNRIQNVRIISIFQSGLLLFIYGVIFIESLIGNVIQSGFEYNQVIHFVLGREQLITFTGLIVVFQAYKIYVLFRKDVRSLFSNQADRADNSDSAYVEPENLNP
ncbi:MAG: hypothetical protein ABFS17_06285 [Chloroflexota bacterium]